MRAVLPGRVEAKLQAVCTACWNARHLIAYISGNALIILSDAYTILQTIYDDESNAFEAVAIDEVTGRIAICAGLNVKIYEPYSLTEDSLKWSLQHSITVGKDAAHLLSWGAAGELLVSSTYLILVSTSNNIRAPIWKRRLANPADFASISYDSAYMASCGKHDRLLKIWRRLSFGVDDTDFDFSYLRHPGTISGMRWRKPFHHEQILDAVIYTLCIDNKLRIWTTIEQHGSGMFQMWAKIDLQESIQVRDLCTSPVRYAFMIDGRDFTIATQAAFHARGNREANHALAHLSEIANRDPEICVVLDDNGRLSVWGLENVGSSAIKARTIFNITHVAGIDLGLSGAVASGSKHIQIHNYGNMSACGLHILIHHFDGRVEFLESNIADLFNPYPCPTRIVSQTTWTGHSKSIIKIIRNFSGRAIVSRTSDKETIVWKHKQGTDRPSVTRHSLIREHSYIHRLCILQEGSFILLLHRGMVTLWDTRTTTAAEVGSLTFEIAGKPLCLLMLPQHRVEKATAHVATITDNLQGIVWEIRMPHNSGLSQASIRLFCRFSLGKDDDLSYVLPIDPAGSLPPVPGFLDTFAQDIALSYTYTGSVRSWTARLDTIHKSVDWLETCSVDTGICNPALASGSSLRKAALVDSSRSQLTIWDVRGAQLEFTANYQSQDYIQDLDWTSTPDDQSILAVGFCHRVLLLAQLRYDYLDKGPAWASISEINIRDITPHPIGDSAWLSDGNLIVGAGNQLFVYDRSINPNPAPSVGIAHYHQKTTCDLFEIVSSLNGPLPVYHPQFLSQCTLAGKTALVQRILISLYKVLRYYVEGDHIDNYLKMNLEVFYTSSISPEVMFKDSNDISDASLDDGHTDAVDERLAEEITEKLMTIALPQLSSQEQIHLADMVQCVAIVERQRRSMDENAARYMLLFRQHNLRRSRAMDVRLSWREINFAFHSSSQDILLDMVNHQFHGKILWEQARECGMFMWITDPNTLRTQFEIIARNEYTKVEIKNPVNCTLFYIALRKKTVLQGLWRMASWNKEQAATMRLLSNNFQDKKWKTVALKNAYALLGKKRHEYAAAFFLLADSLRDCISVILNQLKDLQLAIAITRVYEGEGGQILKELLEEQVLPLAAREGNRWLGSWAFWTLRRRDKAVRALISPVYNILDTPLDTPPEMQTKLFLTDDPALVVLYRQLRHKTLQTLRGVSKITPKVEWEFVLHNARLYDRMGCDLLALDLVRNWEFLLPSLPSSSKVTTAPDLYTSKHYGELSTGFNGDIINPARLLRRRSSLVIADLPIGPAGKEVDIGLPMQEGKDGALLKRPLPSTFEEPEATALLDNFGF